MKIKVLAGVAVLALLWWGCESSHRPPAVVAPVVHQEPVLTKKQEEARKWQATCDAWRAAGQEKTYRDCMVSGP